MNVTKKREDAQKLYEISLLCLYMIHRNTTVEAMYKLFVRFRRKNKFPERSPQSSAMLKLRHR